MWRFRFGAPRPRCQFENERRISLRRGSHAAGGQIPGLSANSYYTLQRAAIIGNPTDYALIWAPLDAPLVMPNEIKFDRWEVAPWRWNGFLASMPVNHYWHTNFPH
jgi:hypothetical protein